MPKRFIIALLVVRAFNNRTLLYQVFEASIYLMLGQERKEELPFVA